MTDIVIYHNPLCGTSRNALAMIRNAGIEPHVVEYLKTPPSRALLLELIDRAGIMPPHPFTRLAGTTISMPHAPEFDRRHTWRSSAGHSDRLLEECGLLSVSPL